MPPFTSPNKDAQSLSADIAPVTHDSLFPPALTGINRLSPVTLAIALFLLALLAFSWRLGEAPIYRTMEGREALVMQEIARTGNWVLPLRNGETVPSKPPLVHWAGMLASSLSGGVTEWSVRFPSALFSALSVALTCLLGCRLAGREAGMLAALLLLTTPAVVEIARESWVDPALSFFVLAALASFSSMYDNDNWRGWRSIVFALALAGATLSKGPVGYIVPGVVILAYLAMHRQLSCLRQLLTAPALTLAIGLPLAWYVLALQQEGWAFFHKQVLQENLLRFTSGSGKRIPSAVFFFQPFLVNALPWSVLFCVALWNFSRHAPVRDKGVFPLVWLLAVVAFFSISAGKRDVYLLPTYPAMALFVAEWGWPVVPVQARAVPPSWKMGLRILALTVAAVLLSGAVVAALGWVTVDTAWIDSLFGKHKWNSVALYLRFFAEQPVYSCALFTLLCALGVRAVYAGTAGRWRVALWLVLASLLLSTLGIYPFTRAYSKEFKAMTGFAAAIKEVVRPNDPLFFYTPKAYSSEFDEFSQVYFYLGRHVPLAACAEQPQLSQCPAGFYLIRERYRQKVEKTAQVLLDSKDSSGPGARRPRLLLIRLTSTGQDQRFGMSVRE